MRRRGFFVALVLALGAALVYVASALAVNFIVGCTESHRNHDDLIVFPGQPGASHEHVYVGARSNDAFSTVASMQSSGTTCGTPGDTAGYWGPAFVAGYKIHPSKGALVYYSFGSGARAFPPGLRMIVRWTTPGNRILFKCGPGSNTETRTPPSSCSSGMLVPVVTFPQWWNGQLDSPDHLSHMSYSRTATHSIELPRIKIYWRTAVPAGAPINSNVSSGDYTTFHLDFFNSWRTGELERLMQRCAGTNCGTNPQ